MAGFIAPIVSGIGSLVGGILGSNASGKASKQVVAGDNAAIGNLSGGYNEITGFLGNQNTLLQPYSTAGNQAVNQLAAGVAPGGQFTQSGQSLTPDQILAQDPGYAFQQQQGAQAISRGAAAQGTGISGGELKDLTTYSQNLAENAYQQAFQNFNQTQNQNFSRLLSTAGLGAQETNQMAANTGTAAQEALGLNSQIAGIQQQVGEAQAGGTLGSANAINQAISGIISSIGQGSSLYSANANSAPNASTPTWNPTTGTEVYPSAPAATANLMGTPAANPFAISGFGNSSLTPSNGAPGSTGLPFGY